MVINKCSNTGHFVTFTTEKYPLLRIKPDKCSSQYYCLHVFRYHLNLTQEINKPVILYYGVNGHGRGLVDAMSGFGVKSPLNVNRCVDIDELKSRRAMMMEGFPIPDCRGACLISLFPDGTY